MKNQKGFSLIELLIVVVIIGIIAAIAIPNLLAARRSANEGAAVSTLRMLHSSEVTFAATEGSGNYTGTDGVAFPNGLAQLNTSNLIDAQVATGTKSGYGFLAYATDRAGQTPSSFTLGASPSVTAGVTQTGTRKFCIATEGVMRSDNVQANLGTNVAADGDCVVANYATVME